MTKGFPYDFV